MRLVQAGVVAVIVACSASLFAQSGPRRDGKWEVTSQIEMAMPNMPQPMSMPPSTQTQCITKEDANDPNKTMPAAPAGRRGAPPPDCKTTDQRITGSTVSAKITCAGETPTTGTIEMTYGADTYTGTMIMDMMARGTAMKMTIKYNGKRLGDCVK